MGLQRLLSKHPFLFLGKVSFSLYALHLPVIGSLTSALVLLLLPVLSYHGAAAAACSVTLPLLVLLSHVMYRMYRFIDTRGIGMSQAVYGAAKRGMAPAAAALARTAPVSKAWHRLLAVLLSPEQGAARRSEPEGA